MGCFGRGPEVGDGEAGVQIGAEVPHPAYGEHYVHAELCVVSCCAKHIFDEYQYLEYLEIRSAHPVSR